MRPANSRWAMTPALSLRCETAARNWVLASSILSGRKPGWVSISLNSWSVAGAFSFNPEKENVPSGFADDRFHVGGDIVQQGVNLFPGLAAGAAGSHGDPGELGQADPLGRIQQAAGAHQSDAADQGQIVIFQQVELHAIGQRESGGIRRLDGAQRRILEVLGRGNAAGGCGNGCRRDPVRRGWGGRSAGGPVPPRPAVGGAGFSILGAPDPGMPPTCARAAAARRRMPSRVFIAGLRSCAPAASAAAQRWTGPGSTV